ncbi:HNH endonuclease [Teichococcus cervicalis]|uniref:HNH endonuclease n=1 Tax=Teichococcus cervicalis TaxID=204525 RepID=UPI0009FE7F07
MHYNRELEGFICPMCRKLFRGPKGIRVLQGDHVIPFSKGGHTTWENYQLLCKPCNVKKSNSIEEGISFS